MQPEIIAIRIPPSAWLDVDGDATRLKCVISVNCTLLHLEAMQVHYVGRDHTQEAVSRRVGDDFDLLCRYGSEGQFETTEINDKRYVLIATPFT
ncbi:MAG TPA: hypothetical protein VNA69_09950 [Thermoanaerobaculia bacterium]|nr:hypothetical protein [Thermoanaerobaculia bacterium]